jgi:PhzF family phenazine biosynthesis protein
MDAWIVDTFADTKYAGNPAGVVPLEGGFPPVASMQAIALSLGLPTTAFLYSAPGDGYHLRWFTPLSELQLCGHATIASAAWLFHSAGGSAPSELSFQTQSGPLYAQRRNGYISLSLPAMEVTTCPPPAGIEAALGAKICSFARAVDDYIMWVESEEIVAALRPDFELLRSMPCRGHIVTAPGNGNRTVDFVSRTFFPGLGVNEDQVCVSAHCKLVPWWARNLRKNNLSAVQLSERGGALQLEFAGDRVHVGGPAIVRHSVPLV